MEAPFFLIRITGFMRIRCKNAPGGRYNDLSSLVWNRRMRRTELVNYPYYKKAIVFLKLEAPPYMVGYYIKRGTWGYQSK